jgi:ATP-dependent Clp protease, protease subunit
VFFITKQRKERTRMNKFWQFKITEEGKKGELYIYGPISSQTWWGDEISPKNFKNDLDLLGDISELTVYINSDGGDVFAGQAIHSMLKRHQAKVTCYIDGLAASIASIIAMAGDVVHMPTNAMIMIHNPWTYAAGNAEEFRKMAETLDKIRESSVAVYQEKTGLSEKKIIEMMDAETWMSAKDAKKLGFADEIDEEKLIAASIDGKFIMINGQKMDLSRYRNSPPIKEVKTEEKNTKTEHFNKEELFLYEKSIQLKQKKFKEVM